MTNAAAPNAAQVVGLTLQNAGAATLQAGVTTMGQVFKQGDVPAGQALVATINGSAVPVQVDVKTTYPDGSIKMAVLSFERPALPSGATVDVMLGKAPAPSAQPAVNLAAVSQQHALSVEFTPVGQQKITIDVMDALRDALADGTASVWQKGPLASQARVEIDLPGSMRLKFDVTAFKDGNISVDAMFNNDEAMQATGGRVAYDVKATLNGKVVVQESVNQGQYQNWHREFESSEANGSQGLGAASRGWLNIQKDVEYLKDTGAVANYDASIPISQTLLQGYASATASSSWNDPLSANGITQAMGTSGGRAEIGFTTQANVSWLVSNDARAADYALGQAGGAAGIPWNFWDAGNDTWLSTAHYPKLWTDARGGTGRPNDPTSTGLTQQVDGLTGWSTTISHQPDLSYVPYLQTGERWILDNLQAQTSWSVMSQWPAVRFDGESLLVNENQVRGAAWSLRQIDNTAWISPDGSPEKAWLEQVSANNWDWLVSKIPEWTAAQGEAHGWLPGVYPRGSLPPWQQDYFASTAVAAVARGNETAEAFLDWQTNFLVGRFLQEAKGFAQHDGAAYVLAHADQVTGTIYKTWAEIGAATKARGQSNGEGWTQSMGDYAQLALATLAGIHHVTDDAGLKATIEQVYRELLREGAPFVDPQTFTRDPNYRVTIEHIYDEIYGSDQGAPIPNPPPPSGTTPPPTGTAPPVLTPVAMTLGNGADTLVLRIAQDYYLGSAQYRIAINDQQIGDVLTAAAQRSLGQTDVITIKGTWGSTIKLSVHFLNDAFGGSDAADRNLFIQGVSVNSVDMGVTRTYLHNYFPDPITLTKPATTPALPAPTLPTPVAALNLEGTAAANTLVGGAGADIIRGLGGNDVMTGGAGKDTFLLARGAGQDRITDFASGADRLFFSGIDPASLKARIATVDGKAGTMITYGGDSVFLTGVRSLAKGDIVFADVPVSPSILPAAQAAASATPGFAPVQRTIGTGPDTLVLKIAQDAWQGSAQYQVFVNDQQFGGTLTASALRANGTADTLTLKGSWGAANVVEVRFLNDAWGGTAATDRNLHVQGISLNGHDQQGMTAMLGTSGAVKFSVTEPVTPRSLSYGSGTDTMVLKVAQDFWLGNAQYTISVNGQQVGGVITAASVRANGQADTITIKGNWGDSVQLSVNFLNDAWGGNATADRNLHLGSVSLNGIDLGVSSVLGVSGARSFTLAKPVAIPEASYAQILEGTSGANTLLGGAGADLLRGAAGADVMTGGAGADTFLFANGAGADRVTDFASGADRLFFQGIASASVKAAAATVGGASGIMLTYGTAGDSVFLVGVTQLSAGDLVFG